jgi:16S rRNA (guanine966-N2)-methyltransferase
MMRRRPEGRPAAAPGRVRIIGGSLRGSKLEVPAVAGLRPTSDRVRETLFNWLAPVVEGSRVLDLYAGTGALGIEAASRGAREVVLVERDPVAAAALRAHVARLKAVACRVEACAAETFLRGAPQPFDLVLLDPPFAAGAWTPAIAALEAGWLAPGAWLYVEAPADAPVDPGPRWQAWRDGRAGQVRYALWRRAS